MPSPLANSSTIRYSLRRYDGADQILQVQLAYTSRLISRSPSAGLPYEIIVECPSTRVADALFPLPLRELEDPLLCEAYVAESIRSLNLDPVATDAIARKIAPRVVQLSAKSYDEKFRLVADIDCVEMLWPVEEEEEEERSVVMEEIVVLEEAPVSVAPPETAIGRTKKRKFDEIFGRETEMEICCICHDELNGRGRKEKARIPCGHFYHKSCILEWLDRSNSCPLCRSKVVEKEAKRT